LNRSQFDQLVLRIGSEPHGTAGSTIAIDALLIGEGASQFKHVFTPHGDGLHEVRSLSKVVLALCVGIAIESGQHSIDGEALGLDTRIWSTLRRSVGVVSQENITRLERVTVRHLLTQTAGYSDGELMCSSWLTGKDRGRLLDILFNVPVEFEPGERFVYSNASAFLLSAFFQEISGETVYKAAQRDLFLPLGISDHAWTSYGKYSAGATGLYLRVNDLHKIGSLLLRRGSWKGRQIVSASFAGSMGRKHVNVFDDRWRETALSPTGYGFLVWINKDGYYATGANGQYLVVQPEKEIVVSIFANDRSSGAMLSGILAAL
jgi:CubicO group peptidase (beta-lactamase class C family)